MLLAFHLFTIVIATFIQFTTQVPYQGSDVHQDPYKRHHYEKPWYLRQELHALDGSIPEESDGMIIRSRQVKENNTPGKEHNILGKNIKSKLSKIVLRSDNPPEVQPSARHSQEGGWIKWTGKNKLSQVHVSVNGETVFHRDTDKDGGESVDVDVNNIYEPPVRDYIHSNHREVYQDEYGKRYYRIENEYVNVDGILRPVYEDINGKRFYRPVRKPTGGSNWFAFTDFYGNTHYTQSYHVRVSTRTTKKYPKHQEPRPTRQTTSRDREHRPTRQQASDRGPRPKKQTHDDAEFRPTKQSSNDRGHRATKRHTYEDREPRPTKKYYDLQPLKHSIPSYQKQNFNRNSGKKDFVPLLPHEFHFKH